MSKTLAVIFKIKDDKTNVSVSKTVIACKNGHQVYGGGNFCTECGNKLEKKIKENFKETTIRTKDVVRFIDFLPFSNIEDFDNNYNEPFELELLKRFKALPGYTKKLSPLNFVEKEYFSLGNIILDPNGGDMDELVLAISADELEFDSEKMSVEIKEPEKFKKAIAGIEKFLKDMKFEYTANAGAFNYDNDYDF